MSRSLVLVIDNPQYHTVQENRAPTVVPQKASIEIWLQSNEISDLTKQ